mmetsp:Transcript_20199/g.63497  ORF Transcript_20199/g.63497 Transcript_20199/m.63497 type:complete len:390 (-) Transcript_20199:53-1222(-)
MRGLVLPAGRDGDRRRAAKVRLRLRLRGRRDSPDAAPHRARASRVPPVPLPARLGRSLGLSQVPRRLDGLARLAAQVAARLGDLPQPAARDPLALSPERGRQHLVAGAAEGAGQGPLPSRGLLRRGVRLRRDLLRDGLARRGHRQVLGSAPLRSPPPHAQETADRARLLAARPLGGRPLLWRRLIRRQEAPALPALPLAPRPGRDAPRLPALRGRPPPRDRRFPRLDRRPRRGRARLRRARGTQPVQDRDAAQGHGRLQPPRQAPARDHRPRRRPRRPRRDRSRRAPRPQTRNPAPGQQPCRRRRQEEDPRPLQTRRQTPQKGQERHLRGNQQAPGQARRRARRQEFQQEEASHLRGRPRRRRRRREATRDRPRPPLRHLVFPPKTALC